MTVSQFISEFDIVLHSVEHWDRINVDIFHIRWVHARRCELLDARPFPSVGLGRGELYHFHFPDTHPGAEKGLAG